MKLLSLSIIPLLISVCIAPPANDYVETQGDSQQYLGSQEDHSSKYLPPDDSMMASFSSVTESQLMDGSGTQINQLPNDALNIMAMLMHSTKEITNLALVSRSFHNAPTVKVIRNILRFCWVKGDRVFPNLELTEPPSHDCAESIIASNGHFNIRALSMTDVFMTPDGACSIASIAEHTNLLNLTIHECQLTYEMLISITKVLPESNLTSLDLHDNRIGDRGAIAIAAALPKSMLTSLNLEWNEIGDEGAIAIAAALPLSKLTSLNLEINDIGVLGASAIATALPQSKLTTLDLGYNNIGDDGAIAIGTAMPNSKLMALDLSDNLLTSLGVQKLLNQLALLRRDNFELIFDHPR